jgi:outer membrane cobalamin receptor
VRILAAAVALIVSCAAPAQAGQAQHAFEGRPLADALRALQRRGLQIVFSSEIVTPAMRVVAEPRAASARQQLDELLAPHGLEAEAGPGRVIQVVRAKPAAASPSARDLAEARTIGRGKAADRNDPASSEGARTPHRYTDRVTVTGSRTDRVDPGVASEVSLDTRALQSMSSVLQDDPLQAVHALPGVAATDDFRSEFSVRGSPHRQVGMVIDGVATTWLQHMVYGRTDAGSLSMFGSYSVERATLQAGAYPQRYDDRLGAQLDITLREGSRDGRQIRGSVGGTSAAFVAEGPLGRERRGSWIVSARNSYRAWPLRQATPDDVGFAFADAHAKLVYDFSPTQQFTVTAVGGRSTLDTVDEPLLGPLASGTTEAALLTMGWRTTLGSRTAIRQRASVIAQDFVNTRPTGQSAGRRSNRAFAYRGELLRTLFGGTFEAGGEVRQLQGVRHVLADGPAFPSDDFGATWSTRSAYLHVVRAIGRGVSIAGGLRAAGSTLVHENAAAPWILAEWSFEPGWTLNASAGVSEQFPELDAVRSMSGSPALEPEHATHVDVGIGRRLGHGFRWQATVFNRVERDVLRAPNFSPRLMSSVMPGPSDAGRYQNALQGASRGVELLVERTAAGRLSGWVSYAYGKTRQTDIITGEAFWGDFDQRHAINAAGVFSLSDRTSLSLLFRGSSNTPVPGYLAARDGALFVGERLNDVRLPRYARLDVRAQRAFASPGGRMTLFAEMLNVLNRTNLAASSGLIDRFTGEATGFSRSLMTRRASVGAEIRFGER